MAAVGLLACGLPLTHVLGYESSALLGMAAPLCGALIWFSADELDRTDGSPAWTWWRQARSGAVLLAAPLLLLLLNALRVPNCSVSTGLVFYLLIAGGSVGYAALVGTCAVWLARRPWQAWAWLVAVWLVSVASTAAFLALEPPVVAFHPFLGYFAGSIYDEGLEVPAALWRYRAFDAAFGVAALVVLDLAWASRLGQGRVMGLKVLGVAAAIAAVTLFANRAELGMEIDRAYVAAALSDEVETEHFRLHLAPGTWQAEQRDLIAEDFEFRYAQLTAYFGHEPIGAGERIDVYLYGDPVQKGALMGARRTMVAKLWLREIHMVYPELGYEAVEHELAHVFSAPFGAGPLSLSVQAGVVPNMGVVEGLAEAPVGRRAELTLHEWSAAMRQLGIAPDLRTLIGARGFWGTTGPAAYTLMGSFIAWLVDTRGRDGVLAAYADADFEGVYGEDVDTLVSGWERFVDAIVLHPDVLPLAAYYFERPTLFDQRCARFVGALRAEAADALTAHRVDLARACFVKILAVQPDSPDVQLEYAQLQLLAGQPAAAREGIERLLARPELARVHRARARLIHGDTLLAADPPRAVAIYKEALDPGLPLQLRRGIQARIMLIEKGFSGVDQVFGAGTPPTLRLHRLERWRDRDPDDPIVNYLLGRELAAEHAWPEAVPHLETATNADPQLPWPLLAEALQTLGVCQLADGRLDDADEAFSRLSALDLPGGLRVEAAQWRDRVGWMRTRRAPGLRFAPR